MVFFSNVVSSKQIEDVFKECTQKLVRIAHLMPTDVHKLMEDECLVIILVFFGND